MVPYKFFSRKAILDEIQGLGVYSDFQPFQKDIEAYPGKGVKGSDDGQGINE